MYSVKFNKIHTIFSNNIKCQFGYSRPPSISMINNFISLFSLHLNQSSVYGTELTSLILSICLQWELPLPFHNCLHFSSPSLANIHLSIFISTRHFTCVLFLSCSAQHFVSYSILGPRPSIQFSYQFSRYAPIAKETFEHSSKPTSTKRNSCAPK